MPFLFLYVCIRFHKDLIKSFNAQTITESDEGIGKINVVAQDIGRVLLNLLNNAFYLKNGDYTTALKHYRDGIALATEIDFKKDVMDNCNGMAKTFWTNERRRRKRVYRSFAIMIQSKTC